MHLAYRLPLCALLVAACGDDKMMTTSATATDASTTAAGSTSTSDPTTSTTGVPTTSGSTTDSSGGSSSTGAPMPVCSEQKNEADCINSDCKWTQVVSYLHGTQGCQGNVKDWCIPKMNTGPITAVWRDNGGDIEVFQFPFEPADLGPEWQACDCNGPLACLCTAIQLDCPERLDEFCGAITTENGCINATVAGSNACGFFKVFPEGPADGACTGDPFASQCLPALNAGANTCMQASFPQYPGICDTLQNPIFWRDNNGTFEHTMACGPEPAGWNKCLPGDMNQPSDCKCACK